MKILMILQNKMLWKWNSIIGDRKLNTLKIRKRIIRIREILISIKQTG